MIARPGGHHRRTLPWPARCLTGPTWSGPHRTVPNGWSPSARSTTVALWCRAKSHRWSPVRTPCPSGGATGPPAPRCSSRRCSSPVSRVSPRSRHPWWQRAALQAVWSSGVPQRLRPGFRDNDGRCCGTAGVGDVVLDLWQRDGREEDLHLAVVLADALVARVLGTGGHRWWQFVEHRASSRCSRRARGACRVRPASLPTCSGSDACLTKASTLLQSRGLTTGGPSGRDDPARGQPRVGLTREVAVVDDLDAAVHGSGVVGGKEADHGGDAAGAHEAPRG